MSRIDDMIKENMSEDGTILNLRDKYIGLRGTMEVCQKEILKTVKVLTLSGNQTGDEGIDALVECPYLQNVETLNLNQNDIGDEGGIALANATNLPKLTSLSLFGNIIGDEGARAFASSPQSKKYIKLDLYKNQFTNDAIKALTESENLKNCAQAHPLSVVEPHPPEVSNLSFADHGDGLNFGSETLEMEHDLDEIPGRHLHRAVHHDVVSDLAGRHVELAGARRGYREPSGIVRPERRHRIPNGRGQRDDDVGQPAVGVYLTHQALQRLRGTGSRQQGDTGKHQE